MASTATHPAGCTAPGAMTFSQSKSRSPISASYCGRWTMTQWDTSCVAFSRAASSIGLYSTMRVRSTPQLADRTTFGCASSMRAASSDAAKPPNTTECTAPTRAHASIEMTASGIIGM